MTADELKKLIGILIKETVIDADKFEKTIEDIFRRFNVELEKLLPEEVVKIISTAVAFLMVTQEVAECGYQFKPEELKAIQELLENELAERKNEAVS